MAEYGELMSDLKVFIPLTIHDIKCATYNTLQLELSVLWIVSKCSSTSRICL